MGMRIPGDGYPRLMVMDAAILKSANFPESTVSIVGR
jgi:hypothetical protein